MRPLRIQNADSVRLAVLRAGRAAEHISTNSGCPRPPHAIQLAEDSLAVLDGGRHDQHLDRRGVGVERFDLD
jgi:hypothetical protein